jgi:hypothetical protein
MNVTAGGAYIPHYGMYAISKVGIKKCILLITLLALGEGDWFNASILGNAAYAPPAVREALAMATRMIRPCLCHPR